MGDYVYRWDWLRASVLIARWHTTCPTTPSFGECFLPRMWIAHAVGAGSGPDQNAPWLPVRPYLQPLIRILEMVSRHKAILQIFWWTNWTGRKLLRDGVSLKIFADGSFKAPGRGVTKAMIFQSKKDFQKHKTLKQDSRYPTQHVWLWNSQVKSRYCLVSY